MEKEFVPYDRALKLKQLGFDEEGFGTYNANREVLPLMPYTTESKAILFQQAFRWFREEYNLHINKTGNSNYTSFNMVEPKIEVISFVRYTDTENHYEEAELACLDKLIEIVTEKQNQ